MSPLKAFYPVLRFQAVLHHPIGDFAAATSYFTPHVVVSLLLSFEMFRFETLMGQGSLLFKLTAFNRLEFTSSAIICNSAPYRFDTLTLEVRFSSTPVCVFQAPPLFRL